MSDPLIGAIKGGIGGLSEAISLADDLEGVAQQVSDLGKKELSARRNYRAAALRKQHSADYTFVNAVQEFNELKECLALREQLKSQVIEKYGFEGWQKVEEIEQRQKDDAKKLYTEDGHDRAAMNRLKWLCASAAAIITYILWQSCMLPMEILIASGCGG